VDGKGSEFININCYHETNGAPGDQESPGTVNGLRMDGSWASARLKATQGRWISLLVAVVAAALLVATFTLPGVRLLESAGQTVPYAQGPVPSYQIYGYGIPTVSNGSLVNVTLTGFRPYSLQYTLSPTRGNLMLNAIAGPGSVGNSTTYSFAATAHGTYPLELYIVAYNGSGFTIRYSGTWSPFDFLPVYTSPAVFLIFASLAGVYYFGTRIPRQRNEEKVEAELEEERRRKESAG